MHIRNPLELLRTRTCLDIALEEGLRTTVFQMTDVGYLLKNNSSVNLVNGPAFEEFEEMINVLPDCNTLNRIVDCFEKGSANVSVGVNGQSTPFLVSDKLRSTEEQIVDCMS